MRHNYVICINENNTHNFINKNTTQNILISVNNDNNSLLDLEPVVGFQICITQQFCIECQGN